MKLPKLQGFNYGNCWYLLIRLFKDIESFFSALRYEEVEGNFNLLMNSLISTIEAAVSKGWSNEVIRGYLPNVWRIYRNTEFVQYIQDWPRGFSGDFKAINMIVDWKEERNSFQDIARNWALGCPIAQQHREKLRIQAELIEKVCNKHESPTIVSLACGSCRDLEPIQRLIKKSKAKLILIDFDNDAIAEALSRLEFIRDQIEAHQTDIRRLPKLSRDLGAKAIIFI